MNRLTHLLLCGLLLGPASGMTADDSACAALKAENEALKARIHQLERATAAVSAPATTAPIQAAPGLAPKPAKTVRVIEEEPYVRAGCRESLFTPLPDARWMEKDRWEDLEKGMSLVEVEVQLGVEHYDTVGGARTKWEYGKCGNSSGGQLLFENGRLIDWRSPS